MNKKIFLIPILLVGLLASCNDSTSNSSESLTLPTTSEVTTTVLTSETVSVTGVTLNETAIELIVGEDKTLIANVAPSNATVLGVSWSSSNEEIASVSNEGKVTALKAGRATIEVKTVDGQFTANCVVTVKNAPIEVEFVYLNKEKLVLGVGEKEELTATVMPNNAVDKTITWSSENEEIAEVSKSGSVVANKEGVTTITATSASGKTATCSVTVNNPMGKFTTGSTNKLATKAFTATETSASIAKYDENDFAYYKYDYTGKYWYIEAFVYNIEDNVTNADIHNGPVEWWTFPVGVGGVNDHGAYSFGAVSYGTFNSVDAYVRLTDNQTPGLAAAGDYWNLGANLHGEYSYTSGQANESWLDFEEGFKITMMRYGDVYYYAINNAYVEYNSKYVEGFGEDSPALVTYKTGASYKNIKVFTGSDVTTLYNDWMNNVNQMSNDKFKALDSFNNYVDLNLTNYSNAYTVESDISASIKGGICFTNNGNRMLVTTKEGYSKFYMEFTYSWKNLAAWVKSGDYPWVSIGAGHFNFVSGSPRFLNMGPAYNGNYATSISKSLAYSCDFNDWQHPDISDQLDAGLKVTNTYKLAILRDFDAVYFYINDYLVLKDMNGYVFGDNKNTPTYPMIGNIWGGSGEVNNLKLLTTESEVDAKLAELVQDDGEDLPILDDAKVIIMAGQSNMEGHTPTSDLSYQEKVANTPNTDHIQIYYHGNYMQNTSNGKFKQVKFGQGRDITCFGPEVGLANELAAEDPDQNYYLIKVSEGGSDLAQLWRSPAAGGAGRLYKLLMEKIADCVQFFNDNDVKFEIDGFCWMQGEADACNTGWANAYYNATKKFYSSICDDLADYIPETGLKFIDAGISDKWTLYETVNAAKKQFAEDEDNATYFSTIENGLVPRAADWAHWTGQCQLKLGKLFADAYLEANGR